MVFLMDKDHVTWETRTESLQVQYSLSHFTDIIFLFQEDTTLFTTKMQVDYTHTNDTTPDTNNSQCNQSVANFST